MSASEGVCTSLQAQQVVNRWSLDSELPYREKNSVLSPNEIFNSHLQRTLSHGVLGELAPLVMKARAERPHKLYQLIIFIHKPTLNLSLEKASVFECMC